MPPAFEALLGLPDRADVQQSGLSSILQAGGYAVPRDGVQAEASAARLMGLCEQVEVLLLAMSGLAGSLLAYELGAIADRLNAAVVAG